MTCKSCDHNCDQGRYCPERIEREWADIDPQVDALYWALVAVIGCTLIGAISYLILGLL